MSHENKVAIGWAIAAFCVGILAVGIYTVLALPAGETAAEAGAANGSLSFGVATVAAVGAFFFVKTTGTPQITKNSDWGGFVLGAVVSTVAIGISLGSFEGAKGGGVYLLAWGPALWGIYKALKSLRRPDSDLTTNRAASVQTTSRADEVSGQALFAMDLTFFAYLGSVMRRTRGASDAEVQTAVMNHASRLTDQDPRRAMEYRSAMHMESARDWPYEATHDFALDLERPWAPTLASEAAWRKLPTNARASYSHQGALVVQAVAAGLAAGPSA